MLHTPNRYFSTLFPAYKTPALDRVHELLELQSVRTSTIGMPISSSDHRAKLNEALPFPDGRKSMHGQPSAAPALTARRPAELHSSREGAIPSNRAAAPPYPRFCHERKRTRKGTGR
ncbi:hypothetical protein NL676_014988 [Syzygium grande]|nr:hypothetical protein NL676_014988 [Syzygium grande]